MSENGNPKRYDLEDRTAEFAKAVRRLVKELPKTVGTIEDAKQLVRASGSVGANYIEANEALSKKDFVMRIKICRKEAKEARYFLDLIGVTDLGQLDDSRTQLMAEATGLLKIFSAILRKSE